MVVRERHGFQFAVLGSTGLCSYPCLASLPNCQSIETLSSTLGTKATVCIDFSNTSIIVWYRPNSCTKSLILYHVCGSASLFKPWLIHFLSDFLSFIVSILSFWKPYSLKIDLLDRSFIFLMISFLFYTSLSCYFTF